MTNPNDDLRTNDNQARELMQELLDVARVYRTEHDSPYARDLIIRAGAYLATPAGSTERPSDASMVAAMIEHFGLRDGAMADDECTCDTCVIIRRARELDASRPPAKGSDQHVGEMIACRAMLNGVIVPPAKEAEAAGDAPHPLAKPDEDGHCEVCGLPYEGENESGAHICPPGFKRPAPPAVAVGVSDALRMLVEACEAEFECDARDEEGTLLFLDEDKVSFPEDECNITFGHIRKARAALESFAKRSAAANGDEAVAVDFYSRNPSAALVDFTNRVAQGRADPAPAAAPRSEPTGAADASGGVRQ